MKLSRLIGLAAVWGLSYLALTFADSPLVLIVVVAGANIAGYLEGSLR